MAGIGLLSTARSTWRLGVVGRATPQHLPSAGSLPNPSYVRAGEGAFSRHRCVLGARAAAASRRARPVEILLSEHVQLPRNRSSEAAARTSSYSLVLAGTQWGLGAHARWELPCCFLGQPVNISGYCCDNRRRKLCFERSLPSDILFVSFIREGSDSVERGP